MQVVLLLLTLSASLLDFITSHGAGKSRKTAGKWPMQQFVKRNNKLNDSALV